ncbi:hypothetical protein NHX12_032786 [Muraenolepis orangiensis]|uniref:Uncharacterized protein n=1 Tax=Muraenolepis orangiensis TaxID=630683 RepID=A0A9Q0E1C5_9TELE|nr:hypothetical protein NHX12_032786 [Muraenolepis orangiensis]
MYSTAKTRGYINRDGVRLTYLLAKGKLIDEQADTFLGLSRGLLAATQNTPTGTITTEEIGSWFALRGALECGVDQASETEKPMVQAWSSFIIARLPTPGPHGWTVCGDAAVQLNRSNNTADIGLHENLLCVTKRAFYGSEPSLGRTTTRGREREREREKHPHNPPHFPTSGTFRSEKFVWDVVNN